MDRLFKVFVLLAGLLVAATVGFKSVQDSFRVNRWQRGSELESTIDSPDGSTLIMTRIDRKDFPAPPYPQAGDTITAIDGNAAQIDSLNSRIIDQPPGREISIQYKDSDTGDTLQTVLRTSSVPTGLSIFVITMFVIRILIALGFIVTGFWAFNKQPGSAAVRALSLFCFSMAAMVMLTFRLGYERIDVFTVPGFQYLEAASGIILAGLGAFWLHLQLLFPRPRRFVGSHPVITGILIYLPVAAAVLLSALTDLPGIEIGLLILILGQVAAGFGFLIRHSIKTESNLEKRQARLVLWGTGTGIFSLVAAVAVIVLFRGWLVSISAYFIIGLFLLVLLALLLSPVSFIYAFGKYRLLEVEGRIKRGTRYLSVTIALLAVFFSLLYLISGLLINRVGAGRTTVVPALALILATGFAPAHRKVQSVLENRIYPERTRIRRMMEDFLSGVLSITDSERFWNGMESRLREALKVERVFTILADEGEDLMIFREGGKTPFEIAGRFASTLKRLDNKPLMVDEILASGAIEFTGAERIWLEENRIAMVLPLVASDRLAGFIAVGFKATRDDFETTDIEMLRPLIYQVAVTAENLRLIKENLEKQRLENELSVARQVQEGLLPKSIPDTPGMKLAGRSLSCLEVAGDYYDIIRADRDRTVLAIGDVSGKGAGAAMLMSNLQASIRTAVRIGSDLREMMRQINDLIYDNTESYQFITFFAGIYQAGSSTFTYVNAGHNHPLLISPDGSVRELYRGGLILGAVPGLEYEQEEVTLQKNDLLFFYTDGLTESENASGLMYGELRARDFVVKNRALHVDTLLDRISEDAAEFAQGVPARDDVTLLAARVTG